ncbi:MAG: hypothetical protein WBD99_14090 [Thermodesulfobacteriota bacterium]
MGQVINGWTREPSDAGERVFGPTTPITAHIQVFSEDGSTIRTLLAETDTGVGISLDNLGNQPSVEFADFMRLKPWDSRTPCETGFGSGDGSEIVEKISGCPDTPGVPSFGGLMPLGGLFLSN